MANSGGRRNDGCPPLPTNRDRNPTPRRTRRRLTNIGASNGLLRQYFPKGTDLSVHSEADLDWVAAELNDRPRKRLAFKKPIEQIGPLLLR